MYFCLWMYFVYLGRVEVVDVYYHHVLFFFCRQKTEYEVRIIDWSSDVCSSDLVAAAPRLHRRRDAVSGAWSIQPVDPDAALAGEQFHQPLAEAARPVLLGHARPIVRKLDHISAILRPPTRKLDPRESIGRAVLYGICDQFVQDEAHVPRHVAVHRAFLQLKIEIGRAHV